MLLVCLYGRQLQGSVPCTISKFPFLCYHAGFGTLITRTRLTVKASFRWKQLTRTMNFYVARGSKLSFSVYLMERLFGSVFHNLSWVAHGVRFGHVFANINAKLALDAMHQTLLMLLVALCDNTGDAVWLCHCLVGLSGYAEQWTTVSEKWGLPIVRYNASLWLYLTAYVTAKGQPILSSAFRGAPPAAAWLISRHLRRFCGPGPLKPAWKHFVLFGWIRSQFSDSEVCN